jgi:putative ABC transport system ATP-binding protein
VERNALIELSGIHKVYQMGDESVHALSDASLKISEGEFVSIVGPSGSGKSTMLQILGLLDRPSQGIYSLDGHSVENLDDHARSRLRNQKIGFVFQNFNLLPRLSALRNVEMPLIYSSAHGRSLPKSEMRARAEAALERVGLRLRMSHKPNELSGGQRQRVAIARALVSRPRLILADEPTGNLDSSAGRDILKLFQELHSEGATVVLVTHDPFVATSAQRMISMLDGRIQKDTPCQSEKSSSLQLSL